MSLSACTGSSPWRYDPGIPGQVSAVRAEAGANLVTVSWAGNSVATTYNIYYCSEFAGEQVTRSNGMKVTAANVNSVVVNGLSNNVCYYFMVTACNKDGESIASAQVSATPSLPSTADLTGTWYFHTLVSGRNAKWERGAIDIDAGGVATVTSFEDSAGGTTLPAGYTLGVQSGGDVVMTPSVSGTWVDFHCTIGSRKNMMVATYSPTMQTRALTIFQKKRDPSLPGYTVEDIGGTGSGQNPNDATLQGNGPTRFAYHTLYSGSNTEWEYCNAKVGQHGYMWATDPVDIYKDIIYWDFSTPFSKTLNYDFFWKLTSVGVDSDGTVKEYWNFVNAIDPVTSPTFNGLTPQVAHDVVFQGRMTSDKTVVVGVGTRNYVDGTAPRYYLRIMQLCFIPTDQALPQPGLSDLAGTYQFHKLASTVPVQGTTATPSWAHGTMSITNTGATTFPVYVDSTGNASLSDTFTFSYYSDVPRNPDAKIYTDFANFSTPVVLDGNTRYFDANGNRFHTYHDYVSNSFGTSIAAPQYWRTEDMSNEYVNEHVSLSYNRDMIVMTRTDASGYSISVGLK